MNGNEIILYLSENIGTLLPAVGPVAGAIFTAIFLRNNTKTKEFEKVKAGKLGEVAEDLLRSGQMTYTEFYKASNFLKIAKKADKAYSKIPHAERTEPYNFDWFVRFYEAVGNISDEQMQDIWAKILAGEINKPNSYSLRTIETLKNIGQRDADLFAKICLHCISSGQQLFLPRYDDYLKKCQITFGEVLYLSELGLISSNSSLVLQIPVDTSPRVLFINNELLINASTSNESNKVLEICQFPLSMVGIELSTLVEGNLKDEDFIAFAKEISSKPFYAVGVHRIVSVEDNQISYDTTNLLSGNE